MRVAVVGASGGMGSFFVKYLLSRQFEVTGSDLRRTKIASSRFRYSRSNSEAVRGAEFTILATPIDGTLRAAKEVLPSMRSGSTLVEISSVKGKILPELQRMASVRGVNLLSTHPLFGPSMKSFNRMKILVITSRGNSDIRVARRLFPGANLIAVRGQEHDRLMALTLSLLHALNLVYASTLAEYISPSKFRKFSTPNSLIQMTLAEGVLSQNPSLYSYIQTQNRHSKRVVGSIVREARRIQRIVNSHDRKHFERYFGQLSKQYHSDPESHRVTEKIYEMSRLLEDE